jgi:hypothetical protein
MVRMSVVNFMPWIGQDYCKVIRGFSPQAGGFSCNLPEVYSWGTKHRILMLGESVPLWSADLLPDVMNKERDLNVLLIGCRLSGIEARKTYAGAGAVITGDYATGMDIYREVAFANFFQGFVGAAPRGKSLITPLLIEQSCAALDRILDVLKPSLVIVWGIGRLSADNSSGWLPCIHHLSENCRWPETLYNPQPDTHNLQLKRPADLNTWVYEKYPDTRFWAIEHPGFTGFSYNYWHPLFRYVLGTLPPA